MRKTFFTLLIFLSAFIAQAQIITSNPVFITQDVEEIEIIFDASLGNGGLKGYTGDVYAHAGVITSESKSDSDWKHAPSWLDNSDKYKLTSLGNDKYKLLITPNMKEYYELNEGEEILRLAFVFRNEDGSKQGKEVGDKDIFVTVYEEGLNVMFTKPSTNGTITVGTTLDIQFDASVSADLNLLINGTNVKNASNATMLTHSYTFSNADDYMLVAEAVLSGQKVCDTVYVCVPKPVVSEARPTNVSDGINYIDDKTVTFVLYAPGKENVFLIGDFNDWLQQNPYQMKKDDKYWWFTLTDLTPGELYGFQYLVDDTLQISDAYTELVLDPWNDKWINEKRLIFPDLKPYPEGKTDGLVSTFQTTKPEYQWEMHNFTMPDRENMIIYELLLRDFTPEKTLEAAIAKLDYLEKLGITAIELMPIQEFDGNNSWGYNPNHFFAPDKAYGTPDMYKKFIDECHKRGIAVILDVVFNHATGINPFAKLYWDGSQTTSDNPWFNVTAPHPYSVFHDFNHEFEGTRNYFKRVLQYWIEEYKIDGYRLDLTKGFTQKSSTESTASRYDQSRIDILTDYYNATKAVKSDVMFILEHFCDDNEELVLANTGMYLWRNVNNSFSQAAMGYQSDSNFGRMDATPRRFVGYAESHDEERNFFKVEKYGNGDLKTNFAARMERVPLNIAFATLIPGPKMLWQFEELGYDYSIEYNGGRTNEKPSAFASSLDWLNVPERKAAYDASSLIIRLRKAYQNAFSAGSFKYNIGIADWGAGRRIGLTHDDLNMVVLGNFQAVNTITASPKFPKTGIWYDLLTDSELNVTDVNMTLSMEPGELFIYTDRKVDLPNSIEKPNAMQDVSIYPAITDNTIYISTTNQVTGAAIYGLQGTLLQSITGEVSELNLAGYAAGLYLIEIQTPSGKTIHKVIKK